MISVSRHAVERYRERIAHVTFGEARRRIREHMPVMEIACAFGAPMVRDGDGVGYFIRSGKVVTVFSPDMRLGPVR